jgi:2-polyprenyl-6-methoxyphenol hydroxylase-like FAD-dependent oxidoreductase
VGAGPTGLVLANLLAGRGHHVGLFERFPKPYGLPRAGHVDHEVFRILQEIGCLDLVLEDAVPRKRNRWLNGDGETLFEFSHWQNSTSSFSSASVYQPVLEDALREALKQCGSKVSFYPGWTVEEIYAQSDGVRVVARPSDPDAAGDDAIDSERTITAEASFLAAADGAGSRIRQLLGIEREDFGFNERWLDVDVAYLRPCDFGSAAVVGDPLRPHYFGPLGKRHHRFEWQLLPDEREEDFALADKAWELLAKEGVTRNDVSIVRQAVYTFEYRLANQWRSGNIFLLGDAAHTTPPCLGQGMCNGIRDAANLAWKLDLVLGGRVDRALLESYEIERRPIVKAWSDMALLAGQIAFTTDVAQAAERDARIRSGHAPNFGPIPTLSSGLLDRRDPVSAGIAGQLFPQRVVSYSGRKGRFNDVVGFGFLLISTEVPTESLLRELRTLGDMIEIKHVRITGQPDGPDSAYDTDGEYMDFFRSNNIKAVLVRPDHYIYGAASTTEQTVSLVGELRGTLAR